MKVFVDHVLLVKTDKDVACPLTRKISEECFNDFLVEAIWILLQDVSDLFPGIILILTSNDFGNLNKSEELELNCG